MSGRLITLEGGEGAGKSTQAARLAERLTAAGKTVVVTREPGGTPGAEALRALLVDGDAERWSAAAEACLVNAARADHVERVIRPALDRGDWVISDRFVDSTRAYQGAGKGLADSALRNLHHIAAADLWPDLTLILDLPVEAGLARAAGRRGGEGRFEGHDSAFHLRVAEGFREIALAEPNRCRLIDASGDADVVAEAIWNEVEPLLHPQPLVQPGGDYRAPAEGRLTPRCTSTLAMTDLVGHAAQAAAFRAAFLSGRPHHAWLLAGPPGVGKATFAKAAATWALAHSAGPPVADDSFDVPATHPIAALAAAGSHLDLRRLERTADDKGKLRTVIRVDDIRALQPLFRNRPALSDWRIVIVDSADEMNANAANALLKNLEEPPAGTLFLVVSHSPGRLLPTIRSRCRTLRFQPLSETEVAMVLQAERPELPASEIAALVDVAEGAPGRALQLAEAGVDALTRDMDALAVARGGDATARALSLSRSLAGKTAAVRYGAFLDLAPTYIARAARDRTGARGQRAVMLWERANDLAAGAVPLALEPQAVAFELATLVAGLAD